MSQPMTIETIGWKPRLMSRSKIILVLAALALAASAVIRPDAGYASGVTLLNASYDPTRELYQDVNTEFAKAWKAKTGDDVTINQSHAGSGKQARAVIDGL